MNRLLIYIVIITLAGGLFGCKKTIDPPQPGKCETIIVDYNKFDSSPADPFSFQAVEIEDDCLVMTVSYGGGCGETEFNLHARHPFWLPQFPTYEIKLSFKDNDNCEALITKDLYFDLTALQDANADFVDLVIQGYNENLRYKW